MAFTASIEQHFGAEDFEIGELEVVTGVSQEGREIEKRYQKAGVFLGKTLSELLMGRSLRQNEPGMRLAIDYGFDSRAAFEYIFLRLQAPCSIGMTATVMHGEQESGHVFSPTLQQNGMYDYSAIFWEYPHIINRIKGMSLVIEAQM